MDGDNTVAPSLRQASGPPSSACPVGDSSSLSPPPSLTTSTSSLYSSGEETSGPSTEKDGPTAGGDPGSPEHPGHNSDDEHTIAIEPPPKNPNRARVSLLRAQNTPHCGLGRSLSVSPASHGEALYGGCDENAGGGTILSCATSDKQVSSCLVPAILESRLLPYSRRHITPKRPARALSHFGVPGEPEQNVGRFVHLDEVERQDDAESEALRTPARSHSHKEPSTPKDRTNISFGVQRTDTFSTRPKDRGRRTSLAPPPPLRLHQRPLSKSLTEPPFKKTPYPPAQTTEPDSGTRQSVFEEDDVSLQGSNGKDVGSKRLSRLGDFAKAIRPGSVHMKSKAVQYQQGGGHKMEMKDGQGVERTSPRASLTAPRLKGMLMEKLSKAKRGFSRGLSVMETKKSRQHVGH